MKPDRQSLSCMSVEWSVQSSFRYSSSIFRSVLGFDIASPGALLVVPSIAIAGE